MLGEEKGKAGINAERICAFGFSAGGLTVLAAAGGNPDPMRLGDHCRTHPAFYDCRLVGRYSETISGARSTPRLPLDARLKVLVIAGPAPGFTFSSGGVANVP